MEPATDIPSVQLAERRRRGGLVVRTLPILVLPFLMTIVAALLLQATGQIVVDKVPAPEAAPFNPLVPIVVLVTFFSALIVLVRLGRPTVSALVLLSVWTLLTTMTALRFGVTTYFPALLIMPICAAGLLIDRVASLSLAALATVLVVSVALLEMNGVIALPSPPAFIAAQLPLLSIGFWAGIFWSVAALTSLLAGGLQVALQRSYAQAEELRALSRQLEARVQEQTALLVSQEREAATLEERNRLAREIHDTLAQGLAGIIVQLGATQRAMRAAPDEAPEHLDLAHRMARESLAEARRSVWNLRAAALERGDLADALRGVVERQARDGLEATFVQSGEARPLAPEVESALLRVGQEALANVVKHANARRVAVSLAYTPDAVHLSVHDDGEGFEPGVLAYAPVGPSDGFGLLGMRERLAALGGSLSATNQNGALVVAAVPAAARE
jgi:signal transduction histidine kinase